MNNKIKFVIIFGVLLNSVTLLGAESPSAHTKPLVISDASFGCIRKLTRIRGMYVGNLLGDLNATIGVAKSDNGGKYPAGSVVQLVPTEAMVKRNKGFNAATGDWEFFELKVSKSDNKINKRGFTEVVNRFGGNCFSCHVKAESKWDLICETGHGCDALPLTTEMISVIQKTDPRCETNEPLNAKEIEAASILQKMMRNL